jgi:hypothetical protein
MNARELRGRLDAATKGLQGDVTALSKLVYDLHGEAQGFRRCLEEAEQTSAAANAEASRERARADALALEMESLRQRAAQAVAVRDALEGENTRLKATPTVSSNKVLVGLRIFRDRYDSPTERAATLKWLDGRRRQGLGEAFGLDESDETLRSLTETELGLLFHLGFSEFHLCSILCGNPNAFVYQLTRE